MSLVFVGPDTLNGLGIRVKEESIIIEVKGISERYKRDEAPLDSPALHLYDALLSLKSTKPTVSNGEIKANGNSQSGNFSATLNGTGFITEIRFDSTDIFFKLKNHTYIH